MSTAGGGDSALLGSKSRSQLVTSEASARQVRLMGEGRDNCKPCIGLSLQKNGMERERSNVPDLAVTSGRLEGSLVLVVIIADDSSRRLWAVREQGLEGHSAVSPDWQVEQMSSADDLPCDLQATRK